MRRHKRHLLQAALVSAFALAAVPAWMIVDRASILRDGTEILLKSEPVDPRDLLRGQYVRLNYPAISSLAGQLFELSGDDRIDRNATVFVRLEPGPDGYAKATEVAVGSSPPEPRDTGVWMKGGIGHDVVANSVYVLADYGIERFYAAEEIAPEIERQMRADVVTDILVAVAPDGRAQIKALRQRDRTIYTERLY
jgi:uncharacterized membrane-anchored protein